MVHVFLLDPWAPFYFTEYEFGLMHLLNQEPGAHSHSTYVKVVMIKAYRASKMQIERN